VDKAKSRGRPAVLPKQRKDYGDELDGCAMIGGITESVFSRKKMKEILFKKSRPPSERLKITILQYFLSAISKIY
jgi:hypothetical protein